MAKALATLGGLPLRTNPNEIRWNFKMKTTETRTIGGKVIQILGTTLSDLTVRGTFGPGLKEEGDTEGWQNQLRFRKQVERWAQQASVAGKAQPLRFTYAPRKWDFRVFIRSLSPISMTNEEINPEWELALFPVDDGASAIINGAKDLYIARLAEGVGWKQSDYNGPTQAEVDDTLTPFNGSAVDFLSDRFSNAFVNGPQNKFSSELGSDQ